jgi:hypothetical protein
VKRNPKKARRNQHELRVWTFAEAQAAASYIKSVVRSLREHGLKALAEHRRLRRLAARPGRPNRATLIALQAGEQAMHRAQEEFSEAIDELHTLDIYSLDPLQGQALVPFVHDEQLAWYIFDLFDPKPFRFWRFQTDPDETRRPVTAGQKGLSGSTRGT